jgi:hypothetical protein
MRPAPRPDHPRSICVVELIRQPPELLSVSGASLVGKLSVIEKYRDVGDPQNVQIAGGNEGPIDQFCSLNKHRRQPLFDGSGPLWPSHKAGAP